MMDVMIDLETLGSVPRCVILSIGAVVFDPRGSDVPDTSRTFHAHIDVRSSQRAGLMIDGATVMWWLGQSEEARQELLKAETHDLFAVLGHFAAWTDWPRVGGVWAKGPSFDCAILASAYRAVSMEPPWPYSRERCVRTALDMAGMPSDTMAYRTAADVRHSALGDALAQARAVQAALAKTARASPDDDDDAPG
jgi:hypothetical protein